MAIKMVREPSDTPNITNIDDIIPFRYAYGNQNGFVLGRGTEISNTISGLNFTINSGRLVLQGVECDIDASGVTVTIDNIATKRYYTVYLQVNLATNTATVLATYDTANYPNPPASDDLTENSTGTAYLVLYHFTATSGVISEVNKIVESIKYINNDFIKNIKVNNAVNSDKINNLEIKQVEGDILQNGDYIIPQNELIWGDTQSPVTISTSGYTDINLNDNYFENGTKFFIQFDAGDSSTRRPEFSPILIATIDNSGLFSIKAFERIDVYSNAGIAQHKCLCSILNQSTISFRISVTGYPSSYNPSPLNTLKVEKIYKVI